MKNSNVAIISIFINIAFMFIYDSLLINCFLLVSGAIFSCTALVLMQMEKQNEHNRS